MPMRRTDVKLTRLRIGHTRFTHRHLFLGENAPECPSCQYGRIRILRHKTPNSTHPVDGKGLILPTTAIDTIATLSGFLILSLPNNEMSRKSLFAIQKALKGITGDPKSVKKLRSEDFLIETISALQTKYFLLAKTFIDSNLTVTLHKSLNSCRGVISEPNLLYASEAKILEGLSDQGVTQVRRITILRNSTRLPTKHIILTFKSPKLLTTIKAGYLNCKIRPYIPNPLHCFKCQRFGHSQTACRGQLTCSRCASVGQPVSSTSSVTVTSPSISQPLNSVIGTVSTASDYLSIFTAFSSSTACSVLETTTTTSNTIPTTSQDTTQTSKLHRKKRPPKNQSNTIKPKIEIKTAPHTPRKSAYVPSTQRMRKI
ncbi:uncharacterized protein TNCV_3693291 [Trichonephila clavipes]|nr:uncharacterized protein TNCV_3693291 [Trichonephila clavipes]